MPGLIYAGALGNLIDSMFYGMMFEESSYVHVAKMFPENGYAGFLHGKVVDMLYFPIVHANFPSGCRLLVASLSSFLVLFLILQMLLFLQE